MKNYNNVYLLILLTFSAQWLFADGNNGNRSEADLLVTKENEEELRGGGWKIEDFGYSIIPESDTQALAEGINIGIRSITIPEHVRGDFVPFSNCPQDKITKFEFGVENRGNDFDKKNKGIYGSIQIKRLSDSTVMLNEHAVYEFRAFTPGWMRFRFDPIDLSQAGMYEVTAESYIIDLPAYIENKSLEPMDTDLSDNKVVYLNKVVGPESLEEKAVHSFTFDGMQTVADLAAQGWNYSFLADSLRISEKGIGGAKSIEMHLHKGNKNKRKLYTPPMAMLEDAHLDFQFKLLDAESRKDITEELIASENFKAEVSIQKLCSTGVSVTLKHRVSDAEPTEDGFFRFPVMPVHQDAGNYRGQIEFFNLSDYPEILLVISQVIVQHRQAQR